MVQMRKGRIKSSTNTDESGNSVVKYGCVKVKGELHRDTRMWGYIDADMKLAPYAFRSLNSYTHLFALKNENGI